CGTSVTSRPGSISSDGEIASAARITASSVCTVRVGSTPTAVSPVSMIASTASSTASAASRPPRDLLLHAGHTLERHLEAEIAARDHHRVGGAENRVDVLDRGGPL